MVKLISIMMPAYNAEAYIGQAIQSVLDQNYPHWELIVVNDGSTDGTVGVVGNFKDDRIKLVEQSNMGEGAARNTALRHMKGDYIAFLDADDQYLPNHLSSMNCFLEEKSLFDAVITDGYYCNSSGDLLQTLASRRRGPFEGDVFSEAVRGSDLFGPPVCVMLNREVVVHHDLKFDETITIGSDWVFLMEYAAIGKFGYLNERTCLYRLHDTNISIRVNLQDRSSELAKCRIRSIHMDRFADCSIDVKVNVFYDLLVSLLNGKPDKQSSIINLVQFRALPANQQAQLLRLISSWSIHSGVDEEAFVNSWLLESRNLNPLDWRTYILKLAYNVNHHLARWVLKVSKSGEVDPSTIQPFSDIDLFPAVKN